MTNLVSLNFVPLFFASDQTAQAYSNCGRTNEKYAVSLRYWLFNLRFLRRKDSVRLALTVIL